MKDYRYRYR